MKRKHWVVLLAIVVVAGGAGAGAALRGRGDKALEVQTSTADRGKIVQKVSATGKIQPKTKVEISADVSAKITQLPVVEGQWVEKGAFLVGLDRERYTAAVESAEANVRSAEASAELVRRTMERTEKEFKRAQQLQGTGLQSDSDYEAKESAYQVEAARYQSVLDQVAQAKAALKQAKDDLSKTSIYAPMAGTISALNKELGEIALGSQFQKDVIMIVADLSAMEAQVNVDENDIVSIDLGQDAEIAVDAMPGTTLHGQVSEISNSANLSSSGTLEQKTEFEIKIAIADPPQALRPGMTASAEILTKTSENALRVPLQSVAVRTIDQLLKRGEKREDLEKRFRTDEDGFAEIVFRVEKGKAIAVPVKTGIQSDEYIEILDGLAEGDAVVSGSYRAISRDLENGGAVTVSKERKTVREREVAGDPRTM
ncbi:MAG: efflux RND transporter periplasmic adaptor subunit [Candidatus Eisenbacteria bacterium]